MIIGVGFDLVDVRRLRSLPSVEEFTDEILARCERDSLAQEDSARACALAFAMKEALLKALGCGLARGSAWKDIVIDGETVRLTGALREFALRRGVRRIRSARVCTSALALACVLVEGTPTEGGV